MQNEIYRKIMVPASESPNREDPAMVMVTEEVNGYGIWYWDWQQDGLLAFERYRDDAIELGVELGKKTYEELRLVLRKRLKV